MPEEKILTFTFKDVRLKSRVKRTKWLIKRLREKIKKITKSENILISSELNEEVWKRGAKKPPRKIRVKISEEKDKIKVELIK